MLARIIFLLLISTSFFACQPQFPEDISFAMELLPPTVDYNQHVKPILSDKCFACHGPDQKKQKAGLRLDKSENAFASLTESPGKVAIDPGSLRGSEVFRRILSTDPEVVMPTPDSHLTLSAYEKAVLIKWIKDGAEYKPHWAFVKPELSAIPTIQNKSWAITPIDYFIASKLETNQLAPAQEADKETLLRRLSFDLTGLPPTLAEIDRHLQDKSPNAYEKEVDRLLQSPHYGERMAVDWLDLARFADSHGYTVDRLRDMSPYRDWVIKAFNENQPYDTFVHWQLAGDLMPNPTKDMRIATAFNRNHQQNMEGGIIEEEFQAEYVVDRANTFGDAFLGISVGCAKCHDHKYDPISQKNYYEIFSFFNNVREAGQISWDDALPTPTMMLPSEEQQKVLTFLKTSIQEEQDALVQIQKEGTTPFDNWIKSTTYRSLSSQTLPQKGLIAYFPFEKGSLINQANPKEKAFVTREFGQKEKEIVGEGKHGNGLKLNGDAWLDLDQIGVFHNSEPFTIGIWVTIPSEMSEGVLFHKSEAERLYNYRGYHVYLRKDGTLEMNMAHTAPSNAIAKVSKLKVPRNKWIHLTMTYDGSSRAGGMKLYLNGQEVAMITEVDQLTLGTLFKRDTQPGLQIGAWYRGNGFKNGLIDDITVHNRTLTAYEVGVLASVKSWQSIAAKPPKELTEADKEVLRAYYFSAEYTATQKQLAKLHTLRKTLMDSSASVPQLMIMQESLIPKQSHLLKRGNYDAPGEKVYPSTPEALLAFPKNLPKNRYGLAQWLTHPDHPLTSRVVVNRLWQNLFGTGLVKTSEDFGNQGEMPSHPELLDYLAVSFMKSGWNIKKIMREMVMSATYRQSSYADKNRINRDPENSLLARGPVNRLTAEMLRDNALVASGLLVDSIGGKSVKPYQPPGLWEINNTKYKPDSGEAMYRRSLYTIIKRSVPNPTLGTFDAPSRSYCMIRRQETNTPLQALVTLNDPTYVEPCIVLGEQMARGDASSKSILRTYRKLTGRYPQKKELSMLVDIQAKEKEKFKQSPDKMRGWLQAGQYKVDPALDPTQVASYAVVASVILNSDATITKR
jgi:hypothetical protein